MIVYFVFYLLLKVRVNREPLVAAEILIFLHLLLLVLDFFLIILGAAPSLHFHHYWLLGPQEPGHSLFVTALQDVHTIHLGVKMSACLLHKALEQK